MSFTNRLNTGILIGLVVAVGILAVLALLPNAFAQSKAILKSYNCPTDRIEATAEQIRATFKEVADLRVVADPRSGKILVYASADVQEQIAARMNQFAAQETPAAQAPLAPATTPRMPTTESTALTTTNIPLQNIDARAFEMKLRDVLESRLSTLPNLMPNTNRYQLSAAHRGGVELAVDYSANQVTLRGPAQGVLGASRLVRAMDVSPNTKNDNVRFITFQASKPENMKKAADAFRLAGVSQGNDNLPMVAKMFSPQTDDSEPKSNSPEKPRGEAEAGKPKAGQEAESEEGGLTGPVKVEMIDGMDVIIITGRQKNIDQVAKIIEQIEKLSALTEPSIEIYPLANVNCEAIAALIRELYAEVYQARQGSVSITPLVKPNSLLLVGRKENVQTVIELVKKLDSPVSPDTEFRVFRLRHASAQTAQETVDKFYNDTLRNQLGTRVLATADARTNALVILAGPRDMVEIAALVARLDSPTSEAVNEVQIVQLKRTMADELVSIIQKAINVKGYVGTGQGQTGGGVGAQTPADTQTTSDQRSTILRFLTLDPKNKRRLQSGLLDNVRITADLRANALVVNAPAESMELIVTLIRELDDLPLSEAKIKVFTIANGDATMLSNMLQMLFTGSNQRTTGGGGAFGQFGGSQGLQTVQFTGGEALIPVRIAVDTRTNSIIASGDASNLDIIEAILMRLDGSDIRNRRHHVYRLKNTPAVEVGAAIQQYLQAVTTMQVQNGGLGSNFALIEQDVIVVAENNSNSLIVSATPKYFEDIKNMIEKIDERQPMVMIQVLLAEITLNDNEEFGIELGLQDGLLFDRSTASTGSSEAGTPGYNFVGQVLGNGSTAQANQVGTQGTSHFNMGRSNGNLGFGGFSFSASSESVSVLIRALKQNDRLEVLSRPQIQALDSQTAQVFSGQDVPYVTGTATAAATQTSNTAYKSVGLNLQVQPRISPDNLVVMSIYVNNSTLNSGPGTPLYSNNGQTINAQVINSTTAQTVVSAMDGQTVVLGGLFTKSKTETHRKVPWLGDVPYLGRLFRYDFVANQKKELLIIMTPHVVRNEADAEQIRKVEAARMNWCLADVIKFTGDDSLRERGGEWSDEETPVVYPDLDPRAAKTPMPAVPEPLPVPEGKMNMQKSPMNNTPRLQQPPGTDAMPPLPPEPSLSPTSNRAGSIQPAAPGSGYPFQPVQQAGYQPPVKLPSVQPANYERPMPANNDPRNQQNVTPVHYDAPPYYPATQTMYR